MNRYDRCDASCTTDCGHCKGGGPPTGPVSTEDQVRSWLLGYAWSGTPEEKAAEVDCIMAQDGWKVLDARTEQLAAQAEDPGPASWLDAHGFALSALYECHDGPHLPSCPNYRPDNPEA